MSTNKVVFTEKLTNFYRYPSICLFQDVLKDTSHFLSFLKCENLRKRQSMIYIHIPFCRSMCIFCPFYKVFYRKLDHETMRLFVDSVVLELRKYAREPAFRSLPITNITMGGGTPMVLETEYLEKILTCVYDCFEIEEDAVISIEGDPITLQDTDKLKALAAIGLTRISFGLQTFNERLRNKLGIESSVLDIYKAVDALHRCGVNEWGCDMLYNCPDQNVNEVRYNVDRICELKPTIVDVYDLNISPNTRLASLLEGERFRTKPSNKNEIMMFDAIMKTFEENGFEQVRSVNFQPSGYEINPKGILYAFSAETLGIGPSARTFLYSSGRNYRNHCSIEKYMDSLKNAEYPIEAGNIVPEEVLEERDMILFPYYLKVKKNTINHKRFEFLICDLKESGYIEETHDLLQLTDLGRLWAGNVQYYFFSDFEKNKMAKSMFLCFQKKQNVFNQDSVNC